MSDDEVPMLVDSKVSIAVNSTDDPMEQLRAALANRMSSERIDYDYRKEVISMIGDRYQEKLRTAPKSYIVNTRNMYTEAKRNGRIFKLSRTEQAEYADWITKQVLREDDKLLIIAVGLRLIENIKEALSGNDGVGCDPAAIVGNSALILIALGEGNTPGTVNVNHIQCESTSRLLSMFLNRLCELGERAYGFKGRTTSRSTKK